ncbi:transposase [Algivirga pacifica]|uniref:transposase n=1 Tax=Algivirga pacifica TaxID=1162670 RepID=UPI0031EEC0A5
MYYHPLIHKRRSIRKKNHDYKQKGLYFLTISCQHMKRFHPFARVRYKQMALSYPGMMVEEEWKKLTSRFDNIRLHAFVVMPNHFHSILEITYSNEHTSALGEIVGAFKSITTCEYIKGIKSRGWKPFHKRLWQRDYWDIIIRDERAYFNISRYIHNNPKKWIETRSRYWERRQ